MEINELSVGEPIALLFDGSSKTFSDINVGDVLMGDDSTPRTVLHIHRSEGNSFLVRPAKGKAFYTGNTQRLWLKFKGNGTHSCLSYAERSNKQFCITVKDLLCRSDSFKSYCRLIRCPIVFTSSQVKIDPYWLGLWLGDGSSHNAGITTADPEIAEYARLEAQKRNLRFNVMKTSSCKTNTYIARGSIKGRHHNNSLMHDLKWYNVLNNKHIPLCYKINSIDVRLGVLAGLIDSDGCLQNGYFSFSNKNHVLVNDVLFVARSLGLGCYSRQSTAMCNGKRFYAWSVNLSGDCRRIPTKVPRKRYPKAPKQDVCKVGFQLHQNGSELVTDIVTDGNGKFLLHDCTLWC